jgi:hypothetical protein
MKLPAVLLTTLFFSQVPAYSQQYNVQNECYRNVEQYVPGYQTPNGRYVNGYVKRRRESVPCSGVSNGGYVSQSTPRCDRNSTIFNGLLGGGIAAAFSKPDAYKWSVPLGLALGVSSSRIGCR